MKALETYHRPRLAGFTLAELLVALTILGVIAAFAIPKVIMSNNNERNNAVAKETMSAYADAMQVHKNKGLLTIYTTNAELTSYLNYVSVDTSSSIDDAGSLTSCGGTVGTISCADPPYQCLRLHNGSLLKYRPDECFLVNTSITGTALRILIDPDGRYSNSGSVTAYYYRNGRMTTRGGLSGNVVGAAAPACTGATFNDVGDPQYDPDWLKW